MFKLIYAGISLGKLAVQCVNVRIIGLVTVYIQIEHKFCAAEKLIVILAADLPDLHFSGQEFVYNSDLDDLILLGYRDLVRFLRKHQMRRAGQLTDDPIAIGDIFKGEHAVFTGCCRCERIFLRELGLIRLEESEHSSGHGCIILIHL